MNKIEPTQDNTIVLQRFASWQHGTFGVLTYKARPICFTLEPENLDGNKYHAIKQGVHALTKEYSPRFCTHLPTIHSIGRSGLRMHSGNRVSSTKGCVLLGTEISSSYDEILQSRKAVRKVISFIDRYQIKFIAILNPFVK